MKKVKRKPDPTLAKLEIAMTLLTARVASLEHTVDALRTANNFQATDAESAITELQSLRKNLTDAYVKSLGNR